MSGRSSSSDFYEYRQHFISAPRLYLINAMGASIGAGKSAKVEDFFNKNSRKMRAAMSEQYSALRRTLDDKGGWTVGTNGCWARHILTLIVIAHFHFGQDRCVKACVLNTAQLDTVCGQRVVKHL